MAAHFCRRERGIKGVKVNKANPVSIRAVCRKVEKFLYLFNVVSTPVGNNQAYGSEEASELFMEIGVIPGIKNPEKGIKTDDEGDFCSMRVPATKGFCLIEEKGVSGDTDGESRVLNGKTDDH
jgi:hypothetical protein